MQEADSTFAERAPEQLQGVVPPGCCVMLGVRAVVGRPYTNEEYPGSVGMANYQGTKKVNIGGMWQDFCDIKKAPMQDDAECHR